MLFNLFGRRPRVKVALSPESLKKAQDSAKTMDNLQPTKPVAKPEPQPEWREEWAKILRWRPAKPEQAKALTASREHTR